MNGHWFDIDILLPALLAGLLVTATHVPLGRQVLARGIIFLDLAVAQIAGLGMILAHTLLPHPQPWQIQLFALAAAVLGVFFLSLSERRWPQIQEALIGSLFVLTSCAGILLLAAHPHGGEQLRELLVGQILWVGYAQLLPAALISGLILLLWFSPLWAGSVLRFYLLFALAITISVQLAGVYLVFATLILPALAIRGRSHHALINGYLIAACGYLFGLLLAARLDLPAGAVIVFTLAAVALLYSAGYRLKDKVKTG